MRAWLPATLGYSLAIGSLGIAIKLALRDVSWQVLLLSITLGYVVLTIASGLAGTIHLPAQPGVWLVFTIVAGILGAGAFPFLNLALRSGPASQVVPVSAVYPLVTVGLAA